jgi:hypothetical protein
LAVGGGSGTTRAVRDYVVEVGDGCLTPRGAADAAVADAHEPGQVCVEAPPTGVDDGHGVINGVGEQPA